MLMDKVVDTMLCNVRASVIIHLCETMIKGVDVIAWNFFGKLLKIINCKLATIRISSDIKENFKAGSKNEKKKPKLIG